MRIHFQEVSWDLYASIGYAVFITASILIRGFGDPAAVFLVIFVPGYTLVAILFPGQRGISWLERIVLSFGLSIAVVPLIGLALNFTPFGIRTGPTVIVTCLFTVLTGLAANWLRTRLPVNERLSARIDLRWPGWQGYSLLDKGLTVGLSISIVLAGVALAYLVVIPRPTERFTEFYLLGPAVNATGYPMVLNVSQPGSVVLGIANQESAAVNYVIRIDLVGVRIVFNATSRLNTTIENNRTTWSWFNVTLADRRTWMQQYVFRINTSGFWRVEFLLFKDHVVASAYRELHLFVRVS